MSDTGVVVIVVAVSVVVVLFIFAFAKIPGNIARRRGHSNADAINLCAWLGLIVWPCWVVALIWAHTGADHSVPKVQSKPPPPKGYVKAKSLNFPD